MAKVVTQHTAASEARKIERTWLLRILAVGAGVGFLVWLLTLLIAKGVVEPLFCNSPDQFMICANGGAIASNLAILFGSIAGLIVLARYPVVRPILVVIASAITLWGIGGAVGILHWAEGLAWTVGIAAVAYVAYAWLLRLRSGVLAVLAAIVVVIVARIVMTL